MVAFTWGGQTVEIPKFKLREIKAAAPFIDRIMSKRKELQALFAGCTSREELASRLDERGSNMVSLMEGMGDMIRVAAIGVLHAKEERPYDSTSIEAMAQLIEAELDIGDLDRMQTFFEELLREAGMEQADPLKAAAGLVETPRQE